MDPDATWQALQEALRALAEYPNDAKLRATAIELLEMLTHWLRKGGFPPKIRT